MPFRKPEGEGIGAAGRLRSCTERGLGPLPLPVGLLRLIVKESWCSREKSNLQTVGFEPTRFADLRTRAKIGVPRRIRTPIAFFLKEAPLPIGLPGRPPVPPPLAGRDGRGLVLRRGFDPRTSEIPARCSAE
jgi:hypothetical protein